MGMGRRLSVGCSPSARRLQAPTTLIPWTVQSTERDRDMTGPRELGGTHPARGEVMATTLLTSTAAARLAGSRAGACQPRPVYGGANTTSRARFSDMATKR